MGAKSGGKTAFDLWKLRQVSTVQECDASGDATRIVAGLTLHYKRN
jgi:hypothetical protein